MSAYSSLVILPVVYLCRGIDFTIGNRLLFLRIGFALLQACNFGFMFYLRSKIQAKNDEGEVLVPAAVSPFGGDSEETPEPTKTTVKEYDLGKWYEAIKGSVIGLALISFFHYKWGAFVPLITQFIMIPTKLYGDNLFKSHILGEEVARPFPKPPGMFDAFKGLAGGDEETKPKKKASKAKPIAQEYKKNK